MVKRLIVTAIVLTLAVMISTVSADLMIKQVTTTDAFEMMGQKQEAESDTSIIWIGEGKAYMESAEVTYIFRTDESMMYAIDPAAKSYYQMPIGGVGEKSESPATDEQAMMQKMMGSVKVSVTETEETKKIGDWNSTKYLLDISMSMGATQMEIWATEDIKVDYDLFRTIAETELLSKPGMEKIMEELKKIKGIQVQSSTEINMMGVVMKNTTEIIECVEKSAPDGIYEIPEGFKKGEKPASQMGF